MTLSITVCCASPGFAATPATSAPLTEEAAATGLTAGAPPADPSAALTGIGALGLEAAEADLKAVSDIADAEASASTPGGVVERAPGILLETPGQDAFTATASPCPSTTGVTTCVSVSPSAPTTQAAPLLPACSSGTSQLIGWTAVDRRAASAHRQFGLDVIEKRPGVPPVIVGTANMHLVDTLTASTSSARWHATTVLWVFSATGVGAPASANGTLFGDCVGCVTTGRTWTPNPITQTWRGTANLDAGGLAVGQSRVVSGFWEYVLSRPGWSNSLTVKRYSPLTRCDMSFTSTSRPPGCVFANVPGVLGFSQTRVPQFVSHIYNAQLSGLPGRLGTESVLTRLVNPPLQAQNSNRACPNPIPVPGYPRPSGYQCDECPFASTYQGAATSGATVARSQPGCRMPDPARTGPSGWSRCYILGTQNASAGGTTVGFYTAQRMFDRDPFQIGYLP